MKRPIILIVLLAVNSALLTACATQGPPSSWAPALEDPNGSLLVNLALTEWSKEYPQTQPVRIRVAHCPGASVPVVKGIKFISVKSDKALLGDKPGDTGISFTEFKKRAAHIYSVRFSVIRCVSANKTEGEDLTYFFVKGKDGWSVSEPCNY